MGKSKKKSKSAKKAADAASRGVVGPDYIQVLAGIIASKSISLILCGESHHDAIDVTRAGGGKIKEGWIATDLIELTAEMVGKFGGIEGEEDGGAMNVRVKCGVCKRNNKSLPLGKAREWGHEVGSDEIDYIDHGREMALLWVPSKESDFSRGRSFLVELFIDDSEDEDKSMSHFPSDVVDLLNGMSNATKNMMGVKHLSKAVQDMKDGTIPGFTNEKNNHTLLSWADVDAEARLLNHRRILGEDVSTFEHDEIISDRKKKRQKEENIWTCDDWLMEVKAKLSNGNKSEDAPALHVVLESTIPPWEVELCRDFMPGFEFAPAADCIRCLSEDSDGSEVDAFDPASDGFGSYMDFIFRRLLETERAMRSSGDSNGTGRSYFLHCVDCRDLGCEHACVDESLHKDWMDMLDSDEKEKLLGSRPGTIHAHHKDGRCLPDLNHSPEENELEQLRSRGLVRNDDVGDQENETAESGTELITFPSMESFFGQCTDILYYAPNYKVAYGPFLGNCVKSFDKWDSFFTELFLGGQICRALSNLDLSNRENLHIRSPIMKFWNAETGEYEWHRREDEEYDISLPLLPVKCFLKARGSMAPRTWSSNIFAELLECDCQELRDMSVHARQWALTDIARHCENPKLSDDEIGGGEWFIAYLRQCHREIYDDIDHSDLAVLLRKRYAAGETRKHKIGDISIPSCREGFQLITDELKKKSDDCSSPTLTNEAEIMAKILIDIYMSKLVDAATVVKILQIILHETERKNIAILCYMGSVHTRAICDFFTQSKYGFKKKIFCGKQNWEDQEGRIIHLPAELWNLNTLFK
mmetsp:Transcript_17601/g.38112  ORF Transcript_17601/g.38112 Transcript_17601/m.38112 type:complete len:813 (+) Transcript_17601:1-2439(+)